MCPERDVNEGVREVPVEEGHRLPEQGPEVVERGPIDPPGEVPTQEVLLGLKEEIQSRRSKTSSPSVSTKPVRKGSNRYP